MWIGRVGRPLSSLVDLGWMGWVVIFASGAGLRNTDIGGREGGRRERRRYL